MCAVELEHKNNKKKCRFFVVPINNQALLDMPDIDALNIIKINIHRIHTEQTGDSNNCCANRPTVQRKDMKQETDEAEKCYTNTDNISKFNNKIRQVYSRLSNTIEYFLSGQSYDSNKKTEC